MAQDVQKIWSAASDRLRTMLKGDIYELWFAPLRADSLEGETLTLVVANDFCEVWLKENYLTLIEDVIAYVAGERLAIHFKIAAAEASGSRESDLELVAVASVHPNGDGAEAALGEASGSASGSATRGERPARGRSGAKSTASSSSAKGGTPTLDLNPKYRFDTFVVGANNEFAHAAAKAVSKTPGKTYNPLFLYGGVGLGKTHLLHAIAQDVIARRGRAKVAYLTSERFTNEYIAAIQSSELTKFRRRYRQTDVLLIDDIQFLAGKDRIQEEFFHTFNTLHEARKQIVLTCDRPANEIRDLEHRLVSRFEWGLVTDLHPPDIEVRLAIVRKKAQSMEVQLSHEILEFLADRIRTNIRRLEGALVRVASYASLTGRKLTIEMVENLLREVLHEEGNLSVNIEHIQKKVAEHYDIRVADMTSKRRPENIAFPRQVAMFLARQLTDHSLNSIGEAFGGRDHGTVLHACRLVKDRMETDSKVRQVVRYLEKQLQR